MTRRIILTALSYIFIFPLISSATEVSGDVWGEWDSSMNPIEVVGDLRVPPDSELFIGPGCYIEFQGYYQFVVDSSALFQASGTESDSIIFTVEDTTMGWRGTSFIHADSNSQIGYCIFRYVNGPTQGIVVNNESSSLLIVHSAFTRNRVLTVIRCGAHSGAVVSNNIFSFNTTLEIISHIGSLPTSIIGNIFEFNNSVMLINHFSDEIIVWENVFRYNIGLVMYSRWSNHTEFIGNVVHNNFSAELPSVFFGMDANYLIEKNTICNNVSTSSYFPLGYFEREHVAMPVYMINNIFWGNLNERDSLFRIEGVYLTLIYSDVQGGWGGIGNIDVDPMFVDTANGDFRLMPGSPCIDTGDPNSPLDPDSTRADMGALPFDQTTSIENRFELPTRTTLAKNYPNPFNASTAIEFTLAKGSKVKIAVYDLLGRMVETLVDEERQAGRHQVVWHASDHSSGLYFYRLQAGDVVEIKRMMLLK